MSPVSWLLLAALLGADPADAGSPQRQILDRIVAVIDRRPLVLSELELEGRVELIQQGGVQAATEALSDDDLAAALEWAIGQRLALAEADRLQVFDVEEADVIKAFRAFEAQIGGPEALRAFLERQEASQGQIAVILLRDLRVSRFLDSKVKLSARVTEDDLRSFYSAHAGELGGLPYEQVRDTLKARLTRERYRALAQKQLAALRAKADVRVVAPFGRKADEADRTPARP